MRPKLRILQKDTALLAEKQEGGGSDLVGLCYADCGVDEWASLVDVRDLMRYIREGNRSPAAEGRVKTGCA
jgi:hypothetical protein